MRRINMISFMAVAAILSGAPNASAMGKKPDNSQTQTGDKRDRNATTGTRNNTGTTGNGTRGTSTTGTTGTGATNTTGNGAGSAAGSAGQ